MEPTAAAARQSAGHFVCPKESQPNYFLPLFPVSQCHLPCSHGANDNRSPSVQMCPLCGSSRLGGMGRWHRDVPGPWSCLLCFPLPSRCPWGTLGLARKSHHRVAAATESSKGRADPLQGQSRSALCQIPPPTKENWEMKHLCLPAGVDCLGSC